MDILEYRSTQKIKIISILVLICLIFYFLSALQVSAESLLEGVTLNKVTVDTGINANIEVLGSTEELNLNLKEVRDAQGLFNIVMPELIETDDVYIVSGQVDSSLINDSLSGNIDIVHTFDKETQELLYSNVELNNSLTEDVNEAVKQEVQENSAFTNNQIEELVSVETNASAVIKPVEEEEIKIKEELHNKLTILQELQFNEKLKQVKVNSIDYILGQSILIEAEQVEEDTEEEQAKEKVKFITTDNIVFGVTGRLEDIKYLSEEELVEELGEPMNMKSSKYWNYTLGNENISIKLEENIISILYKVK